MQTIKALSLAVLLTAFSVLGFAQTTTYSTTLTSALSAPSASNPNSNVDTLYVASTTNMNGPLFANNPGSAQTWVFIDKEAAPVMAVVNTTTVQVLRGSPAGGQMGTGVSSHLNGSVVWFGPYNIFIGNDPSGECTATNYQFLPLISTGTGNLVYCDTAYGSTGTDGFFTVAGGYYIVNPVGCSSLAAGGASSTDNGMVTAALGNPVRQFTTATGAGTLEITCPIAPPSTKLISSKGIVITDVSLLYGAQTHAITSIAAATAQSVQYPLAPPGTARGTVASVGGTITPTPLTASLTLATTTTGKCYNEDLSFGVPVWDNSDLFQYTVDQIFTVPSGTVVQVCGLLVRYHTPL
jgi:hypothetical protein